MGALRLLLALGVVFHHTPGAKTIMNGGLAVELFFVVSGFYMALILDEKYKNKTKLFYSNRLLRLLPTYFIALTLQTLLFVLLDSHLNVTQAEYISISNNADIYSLASIASNIFIVGQELLSYATISNELGYHYDPNSSIPESIAAWKFLMIPQAWSISLELMFYLVAPLIIQKRKYLYVLFITSFILHKIILFSDMPYNSWGRRFFPAELHFFLLGMIACDIGKKYSQKIKEINPRTSYALIIPLLVMVFISKDPNYISRSYIYPLASLYIAAITPVLFYTIKYKLDRSAGELSYPVYIFHVIFIGFFSKTIGLAGIALMAASAICTIAISLLVYKYIDLPIDKLRQNRMAKDMS
jgi:peptidoglycan/LPS O-acetylase OafA/YrhL